MKLSAITFAATLSILGPALHSAEIYVTVYGVYYNDTSGPTLVATDGQEAATPRGAQAQVDYNYVYDPHQEWDDSIGDYIWVDYSYVQDWSTSRTTYTITVPDTWIGRSVSFSWSGSWSYSSGVPFYVNGQSFSYDNWDSSVPSQDGTAWPITSANLGDRVLIGRWWNDSSVSLFNINTWDNWDAGWPSAGMEFNSSRPNTFWRWIQPSEGGGIDVAMDLDYLHRLTLTRRGVPDKKIVIDPQAGQILINSEAVLTRSGVNGALALGNGSSSSYGGVALGENAYAQGYPSMVESLPEVPSADGSKSIAVGDVSRSWGHGASAFGPQAQAYASFSIALGGYARATNVESFAGGLKSEATGVASVALGPFSRATGAKAVALGYRTTAQGYGQTVVGVNNVPVGNPSSATAPDSEVFVVGGGSYEWSGTTPVSVPRNAFTVKRGGDTRVTGNLSVNGTGESIVAGSLKVNGVLRVAPAGDISMGQFNASP